MRRVFSRRKSKRDDTLPPITRGSSSNASSMSVSGHDHKSGGESHHRSRERSLSRRSSHHKQPEPDQAAYKAPLPVYHPEADNAETSWTQTSMYSGYPVQQQSYLQPQQQMMANGGQQQSFYGRTAPTSMYMGRGQLEPIPQHMVAQNGYATSSQSTAVGQPGYSVASAPLSRYPSMMMPSHHYHQHLQYNPQYNYRQQYQHQYQHLQQQYQQLYGYQQPQNAQPYQAHDPNPQQQHFQQYQYQQNQQAGEPLEEPPQIAQTDAEERVVDGNITDSAAVSQPSTLERSTSILKKTSSFRPNKDGSHSRPQSGIQRRASFVRIGDAVKL